MMKRQLLLFILMCSTLAAAQGNCMQCKQSFCYDHQAEGYRSCIPDCFYPDGTGYCIPYCITSGSCVFGGVVKKSNTMDSGGGEFQRAKMAAAGTCDKPDVLQEPGKGLLAAYPWLNESERQGDKLMLASTGNEFYHHLLRLYQIEALKHGIVTPVRISTEDRAGDTVTLFVITDAATHTQKMEFYPPDTTRPNRSFEDFVKAEHPKPAEVLIITPASWEWRSVDGKSDSGIVK
jgi:hypothetical protein